MNDDRDLDRLRRWAQAPTDRSPEEAAGRLLAAIEEAPRRLPKKTQKSKKTKNMDWVWAAELIVVLLGALWFAVSADRPEPSPDSATIQPRSEPSELGSTRGEPQASASTSTSTSTSTLVVPLVSGSTLYYVTTDRSLNEPGPDERALDESDGRGETPTEPG